MWIAFAIIALIYAAAHHLRLSRGSTGAGYARWGMRRTTIGSKKPGARNRSLPSNSVIVAIALIGAIAIVLSIIGSDYIAPSSSVLDFSTSFRKRDTNPTNTIGKAFWTSGSRLGDMAFALMPLVVLCALKSPPVALLSFRALTHLWSDKLAVFHRATAWLIWVFTTAHVVLWTIQLFRDQINGRTAWMVMWGNYRFIFGCVAYGALTAIMVSSLRPVQKSRYEVSSSSDFADHSSSTSPTSSLCSSQSSAAPFTTPYYGTGWRLLWGSGAWNVHSASFDSPAPTRCLAKHGAYQSSLVGRTVIRPRTMRTACRRSRGRVSSAGLIPTKRCPVDRSMMGRGRRDRRLRWTRPRWILGNELSSHTTTKGHCSRSDRTTRDRSIRTVGTLLQKAGTSPLKGRDHCRAYPPLLSHSPLHPYP